MKRFYFIAAMAIMAAACQKTEIQNEVQTPIGFSTEVGKQTRAIVDGQDAAYKTDQPFAVYAYGHQDAEVTPVMDNVEVSYHTDTWKATSGSYYWPNDPTTTLNFYAFSPYIQRPAAQDVTESADPTAIDADKKMTVTSLSHTENGGLVFTGYTHSNMYVDFMEATSVIGAKYSNPGGSQNSNSVTSGTVPMTFNHMMTQILFKVTTDKVYDGITFTVESITLKNIKNTADYNDGDWDPSGSDSYPIFPAAAANGAAADEDEIALGSAQGQVTTMTTTGVTMIPQDLVDAGQSFTIVYRIEGTGVASETVSKTVVLFKDASSTVHWTANKKITYTVKIGLNEITFEPSVATWEDEPAANAADAEKEKYEYTFQQ